jgi:hypothetical protein
MKLSLVAGLVAAMALPVFAQADVLYSVDDGTAEDSVGIGGAGTSDVVFLNRFNVAAGGEFINSISIAFGTPTAADTMAYNGRAIQVLLYGDPDGGSTTNATLLQNVAGVISSSGTDTFVTYNIPSTLVTGSFLVGFAAFDQPNGNSYLIGWDNQVPHTSNTSFAGFAVSPANLDLNNLGALGGNYNTAEGFGLPGNWLIRANGTPVPGPGALALLGLACVRSRRRS